MPQEKESKSTSEIDYFLVRKKNRSSVKDVTTINGEECMKQHKLLICKIELSEASPKLKRQPARDRCRLWKLKDKEIRETFREEVCSESISRSKGNVNQMWKELAGCLNTAANKACGRARRKQRKKETGWWNGDVAEAIKKKRKLYRIVHQTKKEEDKAAYKLARKRTQRKQLLKLRRSKVKSLMLCWTRRMVGRMFSE